FLLSFPLSRLEKWEESVKQFEKTIELAAEEQPQMLNESFYFRYAAAIERGGDLEKAAGLFEKTIELISKNDPDDQNKEFTATVYNYLGYMWVENNMNLDEAGELIKTAADLDPDSGAIVDSLGWFHFMKGNYEEAKKELLRAEQMVETPDSVIYDHIARAHYKLGEKEAAIEYMKKAVELDPEKEEFSKRLEEFEKSATAAPEKKDKPAEEAKPEELKPAA
ncbi:MAG: tetratricopeptide repeat protein, partial [Verrucomicrobiales bacterium]|nr:tetratricopeptide repeat protein [Verrucomicrobiales bacterium]